MASQLYACFNFIACILKDIVLGPTPINCPKSNILITGGSSGLGLATAIQLTNAGHTVFVTSDHKYSTNMLNKQNIFVLDNLDSAIPPINMLILNTASIYNSSSDTYYSTLYHNTITYDRVVKHNAGAHLQLISVGDRGISSLDSVQIRAYLEAKRTLATFTNKQHGVIFYPFFMYTRLYCRNPWGYLLSLFVTPTRAATQLTYLTQHMIIYPFSLSKL